MIKNSLEKDYPSSIETKYSVNILKYDSIIIITKGCNVIKTYDNCYQPDTLQRDNWSDMFVVQIISFSLAIICIFSSSILLLLSKTKHIQATQRFDQEIKNSFLNQSSQNTLLQQQFLDLEIALLIN
ncbi:hypothetical protein ABPG74_021133 [Tetrahymena malaccensis]